MPLNRSTDKVSLECATAAEYLRIAQAAADRGDAREALLHVDKAQSLLLRAQPVITDDAAPVGALIGESFRYEHMGKVLSEKRRLAESKRG